MKIFPGSHQKVGGLVFLDAGHGTPHPETGKDTSIKARKFKHSSPHLCNHPDGYFYEGVFNRIMADAMFHYLSQIQWLQVIFIHHPFEDYRLTQRAIMANQLWDNYGRPPALFYSIHGNASPKHNASGCEIWTSPGESDSDQAASMIMAAQKEEYPTHKYRVDLSDGDPDKEARFTVLTKTAMPAILDECGFFDFHVDAQRMVNIDWTDGMAQAKASAVIKFLDYLSEG
jgi:N-acetylmuramoyl-L-alanine amidase